MIFVVIGALRVSIESNCLLIDILAHNICLLGDILAKKAAVY